MLDFSLMFHYPFLVYITCPFLLVYSNNAIPIVMFVISNLCASVQGSWIITDRRLLLECSASLAEHDPYSLVSCSHLGDTILLLYICLFGLLVTLAGVL